MKLVDLLRPYVKIHRGCWYWTGNYDGDSLRPRLVTGQLVHIELFLEHYKFHAWELRGDELHHKCFNKFCVNPKHMKQLTPREHKRIKHQSPGAESKRLYAWAYARRNRITRQRMKFGRPRWPHNIAQQYNPVLLTAKR